MDPSSTETTANAAPVGDLATAALRLEAALLEICTLQAERQSALPQLLKARDCERVRDCDHVRAHIHRRLPSVVLKDESAFVQALGRNLDARGIDVARTWPGAALAATDLASTLTLTTAHVVARAWDLSVLECYLRGTLLEQAAAIARCGRVAARIADLLDAESPNAPGALALEFDEIAVVCGDRSAWRRPGPAIVWEDGQADLDESLVHRARVALAAVRRVVGRQAHSEQGSRPRVGERKTPGMRPGHLVEGKLPSQVLQFIWDCYAFGQEFTFAGLVEEWGKTQHRGRKVADCLKGREDVLGRLATQGHLVENAQGSPKTYKHKYAEIQQRRKVHKSA